MSAFNHRTIISDISNLVKLLKQYKFDNYIELYPLENLIGQANKKNTYNYSIDNIYLRTSTSSQKPHPKHLKRIAVGIKIEYNLLQTIDANVDIFDKYLFELLIKGYPDQTNEYGEECNFFCWHLDKDCNTNGKFIHPYYHFHAGGNRISEDMVDGSKLIFISSPRLPHPPMDIALAIHFLIQNFINADEIPEKKALLSNDEYVGIINRASERILNPYFRTISGEQHSKFTRENLFPLYI